MLTKALGGKSLSVQQKPEFTLLAKMLHCNLDASLARGTWLHNTEKILISVLLAS